MSHINFHTATQDAALRTALTNVTCGVPLIHISS